MRILQIVTYVSPDGAYGGPVRVAINQAKALTDLGHDVVVAAAAGGFEGSLPAEFDGFPIHLFPARRLVPKAGFAGLTSPGLLKWLVHAVRGAEVVHVHLARDLVTLPAAVLATLAGKPLVVQTHGMIDKTDHVLAAPLDQFLTRPVLRAARTVFFLTGKERQDLMDVAGERLELQHLPNGVAPPRGNPAELAVGVGIDVEVLYLARLHSRKRPGIFVEAAKELVDGGVPGSFKLVGPDEGEALVMQNTLKNPRYSERISYEGPLNPKQTYSRIMKCDIYVLPSIHEPFPMSVIEAMSAGKPVIVTDTCGLAPYIERWGAGVVVNSSQKSLSYAIRSLIEDKSLRARMGDKARNLAIHEFKMERVAERLLEEYSRAGA